MYFHSMLLLSLIAAMSPRHHHRSHRSHSHNHSNHSNGEKRRHRRNSDLPPVSPKLDAKKKRRARRATMNDQHLNQKVRKIAKQVDGKWVLPYIRTNTHPLAYSPTHTPFALSHTSRSWLKLQKKLIKSPLLLLLLSEHDCQRNQQS